jgi:hypothetical protein
VQNIRVYEVLSGSTDGTFQEVPKAVTHRTDRLRGGRRLRAGASVREVPRVGMMLDRVAVVTDVADANSGASRIA